MRARAQPTPPQVVKKVKEPGKPRGRPPKGASWDSAAKVRAARAAIRLSPCPTPRPRRRGYSAARSRAPARGRDDADIRRSARGAARGRDDADIQRSARGAARGRDSGALAEPRTPPACRRPRRVEFAQVYKSGDKVIEKQAPKKPPAPKKPATGIAKPRGRPPVDAAARGSALRESDDDPRTAGSGRRRGSAHGRVAASADGGLSEEGGRGAAAARDGFAAPLTLGTGRGTADARDGSRRAPKLGTGRGGAAGWVGASAELRRTSRGAAAVEPDADGPSATAGGQAVGQRQGRVDLSCFLEQSSRGAGSPAAFQKRPPWGAS